MELLAYAVVWYASGLLGSWMVIYSVDRAEPWLKLTLWKPFPLLMACIGPFNLFCGFVYAFIFRPRPQP